MKKIRFVFVLIVIMLVTVTGCAPGAFGLTKPPVANKLAVTPAPAGQINIPATSIQVNAPGPNPLVNKPNSNGGVAGILLGIWHGIISPVTLVLSFINPGVQMYEVHNDGSQYNLGFLVGVALVFMLLGSLIGSRR